VTPANGAANVPVGTNVTATLFPKDATGVSTSTFKLVKEGAARELPAAVTYDSTTGVATLNPNSDLEPGTKYDAKIGGGVTAGGLRIEDKYWSFTTAAPACTIPADPSFSGTPDGSNGWYKTTPTVEASSSTSGAVVKYSNAANGTYSETAPTLNEGTTTVYAKAFSSTGSCSSAAVSNTYKVDTIAPSVNPASVVDNVWRSSSLSETFAASDTGGSGLADSANDASFTLTASAESANASTPTVASRTVYDVAGNSTTRSVSAKIDLTSPVISGSDSNQTTWRNSALSANFTASDALSGLLNPLDSSFTLTTSGDSPDANTPVVASKSVSDNAGNSSTRTISAFVDSVKPSLGITDNNAASSSVCASRPVEPTTNPTDGLSGIKAGSLSTSWVNNTAPSGLGSYTYSASVQDNALNTDSYGPKTYSVVAGSAYSGIQQPINLGTQRSSFKLGSTVPVKFTLSCGAGQAINNSVAKLYLSKIDATADAVNEPIATNSPDIGNTFRVTDTATGQYQFNLSTKAGYQVPGPTGGTVSMSEGTWYLWVQLDSGAKFQAASFDIKK
jgi:hypothetical protein